MNRTCNDVDLNSACSDSALYPKPTEFVIPSDNNVSFISING
jgi:hypothetical protein